MTDKIYIKVESIYFVINFQTIIKRKHLMLNLPNILALIRLMVAPLMFWIILTPEFFTDKGYDITWSYYFAALLFTIASLTDYFDGLIARELDQKTKLGAIIDPLADKMLVMAAFLGLMVDGSASVWAIYIIIVRELFITGLRTIAVQEGIDVAASWSGKVKTVAQMFAIGFLIMHWPFANALLWFATFLTVYSGVEYLFHFSKLFSTEEAK